MQNPPRGRDPRTLSNLETPTKNRRYSSKTSAAEEVRQMGDLYRVGPRPTREPADRERGREGTGRAGPEPLAHRELVHEADGDAAGKSVRHPTGDLFRDRPRPRTLSHDPKTRTRARHVGCLRPYAELEHDTRPYRPPTARVPARHVGSKHPGDVAGSERAAGTTASDRHRPRPEVLVVCTYKQTRFMIDSDAVAETSGQP